MLESSLVSVDVTAPGALLALAMFYLQTEDEAIVNRLPIPDTEFGLDYIRPDLLLLRVCVRSLIMWSMIEPTDEWVRNVIPAVVARSRPTTKIAFNLEDDPEDEVNRTELSSTLTQAWIHSVCLAWSVCRDSLPGQWRLHGDRFEICRLSSPSRRHHADPLHQ